jgi:hypothetical protein
MQIALTRHQAAAVAERAARWHRNTRKRDHGAPPARVVLTIENPNTTPETHGLYVAIAGHASTRSPLFAKDLGHERTFATDRLPQRQADGSVWHPDMDGIGDDEYDMRPQLRALGWNCDSVSLEDDGSLDDAARERYYESGDGHFSFWTPTFPEGDGWLLAAMYDTEDGPTALFVKKAD